MICYIIELCNYVIFNSRIIPREREDKFMNVLDMFKLDGKVALVTAGAGRYGKQMVLALLQAGADVWVASRSLEKNEKFAEELKAEGYDKIHAAAYDQGDEASILALRDKIVAEHGRFDILVNNSVFRPDGDDGWYDDAEYFEQSLAINGTGFFLITRAFGKIMAEQGSGSIINIGSYMGDLGADEYLYEGIEGMDGFSSPDYFFVKGGMHNMTKLIAGFYGPKGVRCNCLSLGGLFNHQDPRFLERYEKKTFLKRMANQTDIMGMIVYLASDASQYMTGAVIPLDGGYSAK
ncbi:MAG: SDR family oxidoreductase [Ruminococcaceae bacterium]|nr:SDR family oxidoreductase [Oscillospiraceae bacterium]